MRRLFCSRLVTIVLALPFLRAVTSPLVAEERQLPCRPPSPVLGGGCPIQTVPPTLQVQVKGQLAAVWPSGTLCLVNVAVSAATTAAGQPPAATSCFVGQLPINVTGATKLVNSVGGPITLVALRVGDSVQVAGSVSDGRIDASRVVDLSAQR